MAVGRNTSLKLLSDFPSQIRGSATSSSEPPRRTYSQTRSSVSSDHGSSGWINTSTSASARSCSESSFEMVNLPPKLSTSGRSIP